MTKTILYTGTSPKLYSHLGKIIHFPLIKIVTLDLSPEKENELHSLFNLSDTILFTSQYGVRGFMSQGFLSEQLQHKDIWIIGRHTGAILAEYSLEPSLIAGKETSEGMVKAVSASIADIEKRKILFPRSKLANPFISRELSKKGAEVYEFAIYDNLKPDFKPLPEERIDAVFFSSPSTVNNFLTDYKTIPDEWEIMAKGTRTYRELREKGYASIVC